VRTPLAVMAILAATVTPNVQATAGSGQPSKRRGPRVPFIRAGEIAHPVQLAELAKKNARKRKRKGQRR
jgi:hypothetical protein